MPTSVYFNNQNATREQWLLEDLIIESIRNHGIDIWYLPRKSQSELDTLFGDDPVKYYDQAIKIDCYLETFQDYGGNKEFFSKFGLQVDESARLAIARRTFEKLIPHKLRNLPKEGDLIYLPIQMKLMEIRFVEEERNFFQLGRDSVNPYMYVLSVEAFKYNGEFLDTGVSELDMIVDGIAPSINLYVSDVAGISFQRGEYVYQGPDFNTATAKAIVASYDRPNGILRVRHVKGEFTNLDNIHGVTSGAEQNLYFLNTQQDATPDRFSDNIQIEEEASAILDFSETNPFGEVS